MHEHGEKKDKESERRSIVGGKTEQQKVIETKKTENGNCMYNVRLTYFSLCIFEYKECLNIIL